MLNILIKIYKIYVPLYLNLSEDLMNLPERIKKMVGTNIGASLSWNFTSNITVICYSLEELRAKYPLIVRAKYR
jgi:hypothetical protein